MLLWDIIRDWFVQYVFGGYTSGGDYFDFTIGEFYGANDDMFSTGSQFFFHIGDYIVNFSDWLSTTVTLIVMISICVGLWFLVRYFFRMFAGLISGR